jgi:hypothetical protein
MRMLPLRRAWPLLALALIATGAVAIADAAPRQDKPKTDTAGTGDAAMMDAYRKTAQPGEHHKLLDRTVGHWTTQTKLWFTPGQPPVESTGTMDAAWILGGRYLESIHKGQMMGQGFEGRGIDGYDNASGQYVSTWMDNMGTGILMLTGKADASGKLTVTGDFVDPTSHQKMTYKGVTTPIDADTFRYETIMVGPDGKEFKAMELIAKRAK